MGLGEAPGLGEWWRHAQLEGDKYPRTAHGRVSPHVSVPSPGVRAASLGSTAGLPGGPGRAAGRGGSMRQHQRRRRAAVRAAAITGCLSLLSGAAVMSASSPGLASTGSASVRTVAATPANDCRLGNGIKHVVQIGFDNIHFFRDNPNVPSDLQLMPNLLNFLTTNGTFLSNNHTPLIAHTADDLLTTWTGLYGDRAGMPVSNSYQAYNTDGTTDPASSFAYWTDPIYAPASPPNAGHDTNPSMVYSATPPATTSPAPKPDTTTPAPWVPFTRAGCDVGDVSTVNQV